MKKLKFFLLISVLELLIKCCQIKETAEWRLFFIFDFVWLVQKSFCAMPIDVQNHDGWRDLSEI